MDNIEWEEVLDHLGLALWHLDGDSESEYTRNALLSARELVGQLSQLLRRLSVQQQNGNTITLLWTRLRLQLRWLMTLLRLRRGTQERPGTET